MHSYNDQIVAPCFPASAVYPTLGLLAFQGIWFRCGRFEFGAIAIAIAIAIAVAVAVAVASRQCSLIKAFTLVSSYLFLQFKTTMFAFADGDIRSTIAYGGEGGTGEDDGSGRGTLRSTKRRV